MEEKCRALEVENVQLIMTQQSLLQAAAETSASAASSALVTATEDEKQPTEGAPASTATGPPAPPALDTLQTAPGTDADRLSLEEQLRRALDR